MTTDIVGSPVEVQEARSTDKSAATMLRLSLRARRQPADFKIKFPLGIRSVHRRRSTPVPLAATSCSRTGNGICIDLQSLGFIVCLQAS
ncbi:MAG: hypothetical protein E5X90_21990 [Mesorhizobium sp.]|nr:MAG: hypothetical protein E5X90_21990 [Mesorhizobium sp.]